MRRWLFCLCLLCLPFSAGAADEVPIPPLTSRVTDLTATLDAGQKSQLEARLQQIETEKGAQLAVLLLPSVQPESIEQFGIRLAEAWKLGRKGVDDGLIIIVAKNDRRMRIEVGYGLEGVVPDAVAKRIISEQMAPRFKQGDYFGGLQNVLLRLEDILGRSGEVAPVEAKGGAGLDDLGVDPGTLIVIALIAAAILRALLGFAGSLVVAGIAAVIAYLLTASLLLALGLGVVVLVLSLLGIGPLGGGGGGGWGGSSAGGFSGGGGGFGGGGASGDW